MRGTPWDYHDFDSSIPIEKNLIYTQVVGSYTAKDKKLWPLLLHHSWSEDDLTSETYKVPVSKIVRLFRELGGTAHGNWIMKSADRLVGSRLRWHKVTEDAKYEGIASLLSQAVVKTDTETGRKTLFYGFPPALRELMKDQDFFGRIKTQFLISLRGKYAVSLYEVLTTVINLRKPEILITVRRLRRWLQVPDGKLEVWGNLHSRALKPAVDELNERSDSSGFTVEYEIQRGPKNKVIGVLFTTKKTEKLLAKEEVLLKKLPAVKMDATAEERLKQNVRKAVLKPSEEREMTEALADSYNLDLSVLVDEWIAWGSTKNGWPPKQPAKAFLGFVEKKGPAGQRQLRNT